MGVLPAPPPPPPPLELHLLCTDSLKNLWSDLLKVFACPYLGASHFGCTPIFWKEFVLGMALVAILNHLSKFHVVV